MLQLECEVALKYAVETHTQTLRTHVAQREEAFEPGELCAVFREARDLATEQFRVHEDVRKKFEDYASYHARLQQHIFELEAKILGINEDKAAKFPNQGQPPTDLRARSKILAAGRAGPAQP